MAEKYDLYPASRDNDGFVYVDTEAEMWPRVLGRSAAISKAREILAGHSGLVGVAGMGVAEFVAMKKTTAPRWMCTEGQDVLSDTRRFFCPSLLERLAEQLTEVDFARWDQYYGAMSAEELKRAIERWRLPPFSEWEQSAVDYYGLSATRWFFVRRVP